MKTLMLVLFTLFALFTVFTGNASAAVYVVGDPAVGPDTGNTYYLLGGGNWEVYQEFAVDSLGGSLVIIEDSVENAWIYNTFRVYPGVNPTDHFAIGLFHDDDLDTWVGPLGEELNYVNWGVGINCDPWPQIPAAWDYGYMFNHQGYEDNTRWFNNLEYLSAYDEYGIAEVVFVALDRVTWAQIKTQF